MFVLCNLLLVVFFSSVRLNKKVAPPKLVLSYVVRIIAGSKIYSREPVCWCGPKRKQLFEHESSLSCLLRKLSCAISSCTYLETYGSPVRCSEGRAICLTVAL